MIGDARDELQNAPRLAKRVQIDNLNGLQGSILFIRNSLMISACNEMSNNLAVIRLMTTKDVNIFAGI